MRVCKVAEESGIPSLAIVATGFMGQARVVAKQLGIQHVPLCEYPGVPAFDADDVLVEKVRDHVVPAALAAMTAPRTDRVGPPERAADFDRREIVCSGTVDGLHDFFESQDWGDGLPFIPPTIERVERFLAQTDRDPDEVLGVLLPELREASVWTVAVNGVMAGCKPEYMPMLVALAECIADPEFRIEDAGSTPGWEPLVIVSGPLVKTLDFNYGPGAMRLGRRANATLGRFARLFFRNVAGLRIPPGATDKATFGGGLHVALAENDDAVRALGWPAFRHDRGFGDDDTVVTIQSCLAVSPPIYSGGRTGRECMETITHIMGATFSPWAFCGVLYGRWHPLLVLSPSVASVFAADGWSKDDIRQYLYEHVLIEARWFERYPFHVGGGKPFTLKGLVEQGLAAPRYAESDDPERLIPMNVDPAMIGIAVAGDPERNQSKVYVNNHEQAPPISRRVEQR